ncbi:cbb3-type cytochrome oxidase subunit 3 [Paludibacterium paludis]|uniref:Cytochrome c oxidase cbb3-type subunit 4 n=1 Tax=Paludibacterium paludis TaxID=1225769 RepID=A0A918NWZ0_9NEIS|nr:cbb3-type cytochrome c oxidase subunit 3 [Paludibacterium paludis]GGY03395.1 hypothetical protein GCM10011289_02110 [Paludibacterium paludis]
MDLTNLGRELFTLLCVGTFALVVWIAYSKSSRKRYDEVAAMVIEDDDRPEGSKGEEPTNGVKQ